MKKIIFLAGMPRSGTTIMQQLLAQQGCVCLGEVAQTIQSIRRDEVGQSMLSPQSKWNDQEYDKLNYSEFWQPLIEPIKEANSVVDALEAVLSYGEKKYPNAVFVDSSKHIGHLKKILESRYKNKVVIFHVVRNFNSWSVSFANNCARNKLKVPIFNKFRWLYVNFKLQRFIFSNSNEAVSIYYDRLIIKNETHFVERFLKGLDFERYKDEFHEVFGSFRNMEAIRSGVLTYDYSWILEVKFSVFDFVYNKFLMRVNEKHFER